MTDIAGPPPQPSPVGIRGWLLVYMVALGLLSLHGLGLTVGALVINFDPSLIGMKSFVPVPDLVLYVLSNLVLVGYTVALYVLMRARRRTAILHNVIFAALSIVFLVCWHLLGMKSNFGTLIDAAPGVVGACYMLASKRVRATFTMPERRSVARLERTAGGRP